MADIAVGGPAKKDPAWLIRTGKLIFYVTAALSIWFFYWFAGTPCPC
jgi:hypothetical protein